MEEAKINTKMQERKKKKTKIETRVKWPLEKKLLENCRSFRFMEPIPSTNFFREIFRSSSLRAVLNNIIGIKSHFRAHIKCSKIRFKIFTSLLLKRKKKFAQVCVKTTLDISKLFSNHSLNIINLYAYL